jgi:hypothetical protein
MGLRLDADARLGGPNAAGRYQKPSWLLFDRGEKRMFRLENHHLSIVIAFRMAVIRVLDQTVSSAGIDRDSDSNCQYLMQISA